MIGYGNSYFISTILDSGVGNPPVNTVAPVISGGTSLGSVLSSTTGTWTGDAPITYTYQWYRGINAISGATNSTYTIVVADSGSNITCQVTATNSKGSSSAASNVITSQTFTSPANTSAPAITGTAQEGQTLSCSTGLWTGNPIVSFTYQWKRNGSNIGSATNSTYTLVTADVGQSIKCTVTGTNAVGSANADSNTVTPTAAVDPDAQAFITAASITDPTQQSAINQLVVDLKGYNIWTKMKALYPFVGGTAATHKWNLKDPRDLDAAFRIFWNGGVTHSSNGVQFGGVNGWGNTYLVAQGTLGLNSTHVSVYSRTNVDITAPSIGNVTGGASAEVSMWLRSGGSSFLRVNNPTVSSTVNTDSRGLFIGNRNSSTQINLSIRGTQTTFSQNSNSLLTTVMQLGGVNPNFFDTKQLAFASIGDGLTSQNMTDLTTAVNAFQVTLSRNV